MSSANQLENGLIAIAELMGGLDEPQREMFTRALKHFNYNSERLLEEYFTNADSFKEKFTWMEDAFMANRDGTNPSFDIHVPDEPMANGHNYNGPSLVAPSRPPSRAQNRSPLSRVTEWTMGNNSFEGPQTREQEEEELKKAMELSRQETPGGAVTPQESGITAVEDGFSQLPFDGPTLENHLRPATRMNYEPDEWAVVRASVRPKDPSPSQRKRDKSVIPFLVCRQEPASARHRIGPLLMSLHQIPAARNFILSLDTHAKSFGSSKEWWKGDKIIDKDIQALDYQDWNGGTAGEVNFVDELKRLMAFLDETDRSYGTADSICENQAFRNAWGDMVLKFFESLFGRTLTHQLRSMWSEVSIESCDTGEVRPQDFSVLDFVVPPGPTDTQHTLYAQWDFLFWLRHEDSYHDSTQEPTQITSIQEPSQIISIRVKSHGPSVDIPMVLYIDRYLEKNKGLAKDMQKRCFHLWKALESAREKEQVIKQWTNPQTLETCDRVLLSKKLIANCEDKIWRIRAKALWRMHEESVGTDVPIPYLPDEMSHLAELNEDESKAVKHYEAEIGLAKLTLKRVDQKLARLNAEKEACCKMLTRLNETLTVPSQDPALNPTHKYLLRSVITSPDVLYLCVRKKPEDSQEGGEEHDQWYRIAWRPDESEPVQQEEVTFERVKEAMFTDVDAEGNKAPMFIYATEEALKEQPIGLSTSLQTFIKFDNRLFKQELLEEPSPREKKRVAIRSPSSPTKRQRSDSADSMASNRASLGGYSDAGDRAALLADQFSDSYNMIEGMGMVTEMTDMGPISQDEIAAHMPPPTPPLSADEASDSESLGLRRSSEKLANFSLEDNGGTGALDTVQDKGKEPEMVEQLHPSFVVRRPASALDNRASIMERPMDIDDTNMEISGDPEDFYHQKTEEAKQ